MGVIVSGYVFVNGVGKIGPWGQYASQSCFKSSSISYSVSGGTAFSCNGSMSLETVSKWALVQGTGTASIGGGASTGCSTGQCQNVYSGQRTFTLEVPRPKLRLEATDSAVQKGVEPDTVRFIASWSPTVFMSVTVPRQLLAWRWKTDGDTVAVNVTSQCLSPAVTYTCKRKITHSGTMYVDMRLNGVLQTDSLHVVVYTKFEVKADKPQAKLGDTVTFKAFLDDSVRQIPRWRWSGDSTDAADCAGDSICVRVMAAPGTHTMTGYLSDSDSASASVTVPAPVLSLIASKTVVTAGEVVTFRLYVDGASSPADSWQFVPDSTSEHTATCISGLAECEKVMRVSGTMTAFRSVAGDMYAASQHVTVRGDCGDTTGVSSALMMSSVVGQPCGSTTPPGGTSGNSTTKQLTIVRNGGVDWAVRRTSGLMPFPIEEDTIVRYAFDSGAVVTYEFRARAGFRGMAVFVDSVFDPRGLPSALLDTNTVWTGSLMMDRDRHLLVVADSDFAALPYVSTTRERLRKFLSSGSAAGYIEFMSWVVDTLPTLQPNADARDRILAIADYLEIDPRRDAAALERLDDALANRMFEFRGHGESGPVLWEASYPSADTSGVVVVAANSVALSAASTSAPSRGTMFLFVNGIRTSLVGAHQSGQLLEAVAYIAATADGWTERYWTATYWNRNLRGIVEAWADPDRGCAALYTRGEGISGTRLAFAKWVMCTGVATLMDANSLGGLGESTINYSSILVHGLTGRIEDKIVTPDVHGLMSAIRAQTVLANNVIVVAHSQGNLLLSNAMAKYNRHFGVPGFGTGCVGAVTLASPQKRGLFPIEPTRLKGTTMRWEDDILWQLMLPNDFDFRTSRIASTALQTLSQPYYAARPVERELRRKLFGLDIHEVDRNYFRDVVVTPAVQTYLRQVYAACNP